MGIQAPGTSSVPDMRSVLMIFVALAYLQVSLASPVENPFQRCASTDNRDDCNALCDLYDATTGFLPCVGDFPKRIGIPGCWFDNTGWVNTKTGFCGYGSGSLCTWYGVKCDADGRVFSLVLGNGGNALSGKIPDSIGKLVKMAVLDLGCDDGGNSLTGSIPDSIGQLNALTNLTITRSPKLTGSIPDSIGKLTALVALELNGNGLTGSIPDSIGQLTALRSANLFLNKFTGIIPSSIGKLKALKILYLNYYMDDDDAVANQFTGTIPDSISELTALNELFLADNQFSGTIACSMANLTALTGLYLDNNKFSGTIPDCISKLKNVEYISLGQNRFSGTIPSSIGNMEKLTNLFLNKNKLTGPIPASIGRLKNLGGLKIENNSFTSWTGNSICHILGNPGDQTNGSLIECDMSNNAFACPLPACASPTIGRFEYLKCKATCK